MRRSCRFATSNSVPLALALVVKGCWSSSAPTQTKGLANPRFEESGTQAEQTLRLDSPFDLAFPAQVPPQRDEATRALLTACRANHHPSCWLLLHVATSESALEVGLRDVISRCQKNDLSSCHAIPPLPHPLLPAGLPGEIGRVLFQTSRAPNDEEAARLRGECRDGFAYSCKMLAERSPNLAERGEMHDNMSAAARDGCRRKIPDACALVDPGWPTADRFAALDWNCQIRRSECHLLGAAMLVVGHLADARNEYERACQYGRKPALCLELAQLYRDGKLPEPVKDRGATLLHVACASLEATGDAGDYPACASSP